MTAQVHLRLMAGAIGLAALAACGGGGAPGATDVAGGSGATPTAPRGKTTFVSTLSQDVTSPDRMPRTGTARFKGTAAFAENRQIEFDASNATLDADATLVADFARGTVSGNFGNFTARNGRTVDGQVRLNQGKISSNEITSRLGGTLTVNGAATDFSGLMGGVFAGERAGGIAGVLEGGLTNRATERTTSVTGVVGAKR